MRQKAGHGLSLVTRLELPLKLPDAPQRHRQLPPELVEFVVLVHAIGSGDVPPSASCRYWGDTGADGKSNDLEAEHEREQDDCCQRLRPDFP